MAFTATGGASNETKNSPGRCQTDANLPPVLPTSQGSHQLHKPMCFLFQQGLLFSKTHKEPNHRGARRNLFRKLNSSQSSTLLGLRAKRYRRSTPSSLGREPRTPTKPSMVLRLVCALVKTPRWYYVLLSLSLSQAYVHYCSIYGGVH